MTQLDDSELESIIEKIFKKYDRNNSEALEMNELKALMGDLTGVRDLFTI